MVEELFPAGLTYVNSAVPQLFGASPLFLSASVGEALFGSDITISCGPQVSGPAATVCRGIGAKAPVTITRKPDNGDFTFAYFRHKNYSLEGRYRIYRGRKDIKKLGLIKRFRNSTRLKEWPVDSSCARILGTDSTIFPPFADSSQRVYIFISDICLSVFAEYDSRGSDKGLPILRFTGSYKNFADPTEVPENRCDKRGRVSGISKANLSPVGHILFLRFSGAPVIFSMPHLFGADEEYRNYAMGLSPDKRRHETFVLLEPYTSVPIEGRKRFQLNMFLKRIPEIDVLANVSEGLFPLLWIEEVTISINSLL
ncbi:hypothetical protein AAG570_003023 [Ranatra chinensis]|uniref:Uncharacterized protein n=1 Tax=Ranatra chinensis TaxID=642074 RepID=A0ABD0Y5N1_9HEMI